MNVLSLFDGMSCGQLALARAGIKVDNYYASEIDKYAITIAMKHYPDTVQLGDVTQYGDWDVDFANIDLLCAGFPCQAWSVAGKQQGDSDPRGQLVHDLIGVWSLINAERNNAGKGPVKFLFENVKMKKEFIEYINDLFGVEPVHINSALVSAQNRKRLFWTNIPNVTQPEDRGILLKDIVHENCDVISEKGQTILATLYKENAKSMVKRKKKGLLVLEPKAAHIVPLDEAAEILDKGVECGSLGYLDNKYDIKDNPLEANKRNIRHFKEPEDKALTCTASMWKGAGNNGTTLILETLAEYIVPFDKTLEILDKEVEKGKVGYFRKDSQANRVYYIHDKSVTLCGDAGGGAAKMGQYLFGAVNKPRGNNKGGLRNDGTKSPTLSSHSWEQNNGLLFGCITPDRINKRQNGQRFSEGDKFYTLTAQDRHGILIEGYIRKLTPVECERLQTVPDGWTEGVSNTQRYKMLGNGWTVDVIAHILKGLV